MKEVRENKEKREREKDLYDYVTKIIIIGESNVGKTNILSMYCKGEFNDSFKSTLGVEFSIKNIIVKDLNLRMQIWDTAGQERFRSVTNVFYKNSTGAFIVFDITRFSSFSAIDKWIKDLKDVAGEKICIILIGNKSDLEEHRAVSKEEALNKASQYSKYKIKLKIQ